MTIPKKLHLTCKDKKCITNPIWLKCIESYKKIYDDYEIKIYDDNDIYELIEKHYPEYLTKIKKIKIGAVLADIFRYLILYLEGGIYSDLDCEPLKKIDKLIEENEGISTIICYEVEPSANIKIKKECGFHHPAVLKYNCQFCQWFIISEPKQTLFLEMFKNIIDKISKLIDNEKLRKTNWHQYIKNIISISGPSGFTDIIFKYLKNDTESHIVVGPSHENSKKIIIPNNYNKYINNIPINNQDLSWGDSFKTEIIDNNLIVTRTDANCGWGQNLILSYHKINVLPADYFCCKSFNYVPLTDNSYVKHHFTSSWH